MLIKYECVFFFQEKRRQGAIIESMHHHGKGVYSGTFSGTLNPALQDKFGRPKRDISTIIHILNDLLCATPQYRGASRRHAASSSASATAAAAADAEKSSGQHSKTSKFVHFQVKKWSKGRGTLKKAPLFRNFNQKFSSDLFLCVAALQFETIQSYNS